MARWCGGRRGQKVGPLAACHSIVVRNSPHHPLHGLVMNSQREVGQKPKAVLRGDPHLSVVVVVVVVVVVPHRYPAPAAALLISVRSILSILLAIRESSASVKLELDEVLLTTTNY